MTNSLNGFDTESNSKNPATIGTSVSIKGEITGDEDVIIHGYVEGLINLKKNVVKVAKNGKVQAHVYGQTVHVEGEVTGNIYGTDLVIIHKTGSVKGNISSPRISIEDGAKLKGALDTDPKVESSIVLKDSEIVRTSEDIVSPEILTSSAGKKLNGNAANTL